MKYMDCVKVLTCLLLFTTDPNFGFFQVKHLSVQAENVCYSTAAMIF